MILALFIRVMTRCPLFAGQAQIIGSSKTDPIPIGCVDGGCPTGLNSQYNSQIAKLAMQMH
jgi:hypothetical protein